MSTRQIEECFDYEEMEIYAHDEYIKLLIPKDSIMVVVDPYIVNIQDLINLKPGRVGIVRIRRPGWGNVDVRKVINIIGDINGLRLSIRTKTSKRLL